MSTGYRVTRRRRGRAGVEVGPEVLDVLDADRQPHQASGTSARLGRPAAAPLEGRLDAAEAGGVHPQPGRVGDPLGIGGVTDDLDATIAPKPRTTGGTACPGRRKPGVADLGDRRVRRQPARPARAALACARSTRRCRVRRPRSASQASNGPGIAPSSRAAARAAVAQLVVRGDHRARAARRSARRGTWSRSARRGRRRASSGRWQQRRGERVVDDDVRPRRVCAARAQRLDVGDLERRVGRRLQPDQGGVRAGRDDRGGVGDVDQSTSELQPAVSQVGAAG